MADQEYINLRPEYKALYERDQTVLDENRKKAIDKLHERGQLSARENIALLIDEGTLREYGKLAVAARRTVMSLEDLIKISPADGVIVGTASINGDLDFVDGVDTRCAIMAYDQSVFAGTQGTYNHQKTDRVFWLAHRDFLPMIIFAGGGGGRPGEVDSGYLHSAALNLPTWAHLGRLSGRVPVVSIMSRYCFAGNAAIAGCADIIIATEDSSSGMAGPAMIEGGGMGIVAPQDVGPAEQQCLNGVIDYLVRDDAEAVQVAKKYVAYFQGNVKNWVEYDQNLLRTALPESVRRSYRVNSIIEILADQDSVMELRKDFAINMVTCMARIEGMTVGIVANNTGYQAGAIDAPAADKMARFMQLCNAHRIPIISLIDCPGFMVGIEAETHALVRHACRLYIIAAHLQIPRFAVTLRACYGLGGMAMGFGYFNDNTLNASWPTGRFGPMGDEGAVKLGYKKEMDAIADPAERQKFFDDMMAERKKKSSAIEAGATLEVDTVIDPATTRAWLVDAIKSSHIPPKDASGFTFVDSW